MLLCAIAGLFVPPQTAPPICKRAISRLKWTEVVVSCDQGLPGTSLQKVELELGLERQYKHVHSADGTQDSFCY